MSIYSFPHQNFKGLLIIFILYFNQSSFISEEGCLQLLFSFFFLNKQVCANTCFPKHAKTFTSSQ